MHYVYLFRNRLNNKIYVGQTYDIYGRLTKHISSSKKKGGRKMYFHKALDKYGIDNFDFSVLEEYPSEKEALTGEVYWIARLQSNKQGIGYNMTEGGEGTSGYKQTASHRRKNSEAHTGPNNVRYGKPTSQEEKDKISRTKREQRDIMQPHYDKLSKLYAGDKTNFAKISEREMREILTKWFSYPKEIRTVRGFKKKFWAEFGDGKYPIGFSLFRQVVEKHRWKTLFEELEKANT